jgi:hypothetical protein
MNLYGYCGGDPVNREDRWGLDYMDPEQDPSGQYGFDPENYDTDDFATGTLDDATQQDGQNQTADIGGNWEQDYFGDPFDDELDEMIQEAANEELDYSYKEGGVIDEDLADIVKAINSQQKAFQVELKTDPHYKKNSAYRLLETVYGKLNPYYANATPEELWKAAYTVELVSLPALQKSLRHLSFGLLPLLGIDSPLNHVGLYHRLTDKYFDGMNALSSGGIPEPEKAVVDAPSYIENAPKRSVTLTNGMSGYEFIHELPKTGAFNSRPWIGRIHDCHVEMQDGFENLNQLYPGSPEGRFDGDEYLENAFEYLFDIKVDF